MVDLQKDWRVFLRFGLVGLMNAAFGYTVFSVLVLAGAWTSSALIASTVAGIAFNFQTSRRLVFRSHGGRVLRFVLMYCGLLGVNWMALRALQDLGLSELLAQALLVLPVAALSFVGQKVLVFESQAKTECP